MPPLKPYIGVAGFTSSSEVRFAIEALPQGECTHNLAIGILASQKTFDGHTHSKPKRYPQEGAIEKLVRFARESCARDRPNVEFVLHMAIDPRRHIGNQVGLATSLVRDVAFDGIQINASPHVIIDSDLLAAVGDARRNIPRMKRVIMQLRPPRDNEPRVDMIGVGIDIANSGFATDILIDSSAGAGIPINFETASMIITAIRASIKDRYAVGFNVAGGLSASNLRGVAGLMEVHGPLGFDVESGVRNHRDEMDLDELRSYLYHARNVVGVP